VHRQHAEQPPAVSVPAGDGQRAETAFREVFDRGVERRSRSLRDERGNGLRRTLRDLELRARGTADERLGTFVLGVERSKLDRLVAGRPRLRDSGQDRDVDRVVALAARSQCRCEQEPSISSTAGRWLTTAWLRASVRAPIAIVTERTAGSATGTEAIVTTSANSSVVDSGFPRASETATMTVTSASASRIR
jgi:hypothetical protein